MAEAVLQGDTAKLWDLITAAIGGGFIHHLGLIREDAGNMRGRNVVNIKKVETQKGDDAIGTPLMEKTKKEGGVEGVGCGYV